MRVYVVWATVLENDIDPPRSDLAGQLTDARIKQYWDPSRDLSAMVRAAADSGMTAFAEYKTGGHTPYDMGVIYKPGTRWVAKIPTPVYVGAPVAMAIPDLNKHLVALGVRKPH